MHAQTAKEFEKLGDLATQINDHYGAALYYKKALNVDSANSALTYKYAESLRGYNDYRKAEFYYNKIYRKDRGRLYPEGPFWLATMLMHNEKYDDAKKLWRKVVSSNRRNKNEYTYLKAEQMMAACDSAILFKQQRTEVKINNIGQPINSFDAEFSPLMSPEGELYFASLKGELGPNKEVLSKHYEVSIFRSEKQDDGWAQFQPLDTLINQKGFHTANPAIDRSGKYMVYTLCTDSMVCELWGAEKRGAEFVNRTQLNADLNVPDCRNTQPSFVEKDGEEFLLFASDRPGGYGKFDLYFATHHGDLDFGDIRNMGPVINSIDNELTPWYDSEEGALFFSSDWHPGMGGYDVFKSEGWGVNWGTPENLRPPINSSANDLYYRFYPDHEMGFVVSNRVGSLAEKGETCCNDIYLFEYPKADTLPEIESLEQLSDYLPVTLYFHNDVPNPRSRDTTTTQNYLDTYTAYKAMLSVYQNEYSSGLKKGEKEAAVDNITDFFERKVDQGVEDLELFTKLLLRELDKGNQIDLTIKGYASPLAQSDYNVNLTQRRIQSLINYLNSYNRGVFAPYLQGTAKNGGALHFNRIPFGAYRAEKSVSDNYHDQRNSVYSRNAAMERKIEILSIEHAAVDSAYSTIQFEEQVKNFGNVLWSDTLVHRFNFTNRGDSPLVIENITADCDCAELTFPTDPIAPGKNNAIEIQFNGVATLGEYSKVFTVHTNGLPQTVELVITATVLDTD